MIRRLLILALLLTACVAWARPFSTGSKWGAGIGPGFAPMQRGSVGEVTPEYAEDIPGCVLALYASDYDFATGSTAILIDRSGMGNDLSQTIENKKPVPQTYLGASTIYVDGTTQTELNRATGTAPLWSAAEGTVVYAFATRSGPSADGYGFGFGIPANKNSIYGNWFRSGDLSVDKFSFAGGSRYDTTISATNLTLADQDIVVVGYAASSSTNFTSSIPTTSRILVDGNATQNLGTAFRTNPVVIGGVYLSGILYTGNVQLNIFSWHVWSRALSQSELDEAVTRIQASIARGHR